MPLLNPLLNPSSIAVSGTYYIQSNNGICTDIKPVEVNIKDELLENNFYLADLSAIHFDDIDRRLYVLSDESALLGRIDDKKDFRKYLDLMDNEISSKMKNSEGITRDKEGNIYIVSEPNLFFSIKKE